MNLNSKMGDFKGKVCSTFKSKFNKKYKRVLSIALAAIVASVMSISSFSSKAGATTVEDIENKYEDIINISNLPISDVKDVAYGESKYFILKTDGSVVSVPDVKPSDISMEIIKEEYPKGSVSEFFKIPFAANTGYIGFIIKHSDDTCSTVGTSYEGLLDFNKTKPIDRFEFPEGSGNIHGALVIHYKDGTSEFRTKIGSTNVSFTLDELNKVYTNSGTYYFLMNNGSVKGVGNTSNGELGLVSSALSEIVDVPLSNIVKIYPEGGLFVSDDGIIYGLGSSSQGKLGTSVSKNSTPVILPVNYSELLDIYGGQYTNYFVYKNKTVKGLGNSANGQLGIINTINTSLVEVPITNVDSIIIYGYGTMFMVGEELYGLGSSTDGRFGVNSSSNPTPVKIEGSYSKMINLYSSVNTNGDLIVRYLNSSKVPSTFKVDKFISGFDNYSSNSYYIGSEYVASNYSSLPAPQNLYSTKTDISPISAPNHENLIYIRRDTGLTALRKVSGSYVWYEIGRLFTEINTYYNTLKYIELAELTYSKEYSDQAKSYLDTISRYATYKASLTDRYDNVQSKVATIGTLNDIIASLENSLSENKYSEALSLWEALDGVEFKDEKDSFKVRLDAIKSSIDSILVPVEESVSKAENSLDMHDYRDALLLVNKLGSGFNDSKTSFSSRLTGIYDDTLKNFEEFCDSLVTKAEKSKLKSDIDNAYNEVILLPLSNQYRNGFLIRLGIKDLGSVPDTGIPNPDDDTPVDPNPDDNTPVDPNPGDVVVENPVTAVDYMKNNIMSMLSEISSQVDNSPNSSIITQIKFNLSVISGNISSLEDSDPHKSMLQDRYNSLYSKVDEVSGYYTNAYSKAESMVSSAESSKSRVDVVNAYKYVKRLPEGIQRAGLLDRLDAIQVN